MRNLLLPILLILIYCLSCTNNSPNSQKIGTTPAARDTVCTITSLTLDIPETSQRMTLWCWAACMEMVMKYHLPSSRAQNLIVQDYLAALRARPAESCPLPALCTNSTAICNSSIPNFGPNFGTNSGARIQYFNLMFLYSNWTSVEDNNITWERIKFEISNCRPLILVLDYSVFNNSSTPHAVVVKGFYECGSTKVVRVNDPFNSCAPQTSDIPFPFETTILGVKKPTVFDAVYYITPKTTNECTMCNANNKNHPILENELSSLLRGVRNLIFRDNISIDKYIKKINANNQFKTIPVRKISSEKISEFYKYGFNKEFSFNGNIRFKDILKDDESVDVVTNTLEEKTLYRMIKTDIGYVNEKISQYIPYNFEEIEHNAKIIGATNYYLVESKILNTDFFVFETNRGNFISKANRGKQYSLSNPISEDKFWKENEKDIFLPILL